MNIFTSDSIVGAVAVAAVLWFCGGLSLLRSFGFWFFFWSWIDVLDVVFVATLAAVVAGFDRSFVFFIWIAGWLFARTQQTANIFVFFCGNKTFVNVNSFSIGNNFSKLPLNCISHSRTESISIVSKSLKSSYSSVSELVTLNVAKPRDASRPPNAEYGPPENTELIYYFAIFSCAVIIFVLHCAIKFIFRRCSLLGVSMCHNHVLRG